MAEQTKREHTSVTLDPMPPRDRRIVHLALKDDPLITTRSTGDGFLRVVEIIPVVSAAKAAALAATGGRVEAVAVVAVVAAANANASPSRSASEISRSASRAASSTGRSGCSSLNKPPELSWRGRQYPIRPLEMPEFLRKPPSRA